MNSDFHEPPDTSDVPITIDDTFLLTELNSGDIKRQTEAIKSLQVAGEKSVDTLLRIAQSPPSHAVQQMVLGVLKSFGDSIVTILGDILLHSDVWERRWTSAMVLSEIGKPAVPILLEAIQSPRKNVRREAAWALGEIGDVEAVLPLLNLLTDSYEDVCSYAREALSKIGEAAVPALLEALGREPSSIHTQIVTVLGGIGDTRAIDMLIQLFPQASAEMKYQISISLGNLKDKRAIPILIACLQDKTIDEWGRSNAARALGRLGDKSLVPILLPFLHDSSVWVRAYTAEALGDLGDSQAIDALNALYERATDEHTRRVVVRAIRKVMNAASSPSPTHNSNN